MRILHISTSDSGGAGLCCIRIHSGLISEGIDSKVLVLRKYYNDPGVFKYEKTKKRLPGIIRWTIAFTKLVFKKLRIPFTQYQYFQYKLDKLRSLSDPFYSLPFSEYDLSCHPLVLECDIIHLHWVAGFIDYPSFFRNVKKPVIWTLHDEYLYNGGFHYSNEKKMHFSVYEKIERDLIELKQKSVAECKYLAIVSLSKKMLETSLSNEIVKNRKHYIIHNSVDTNLFRPLNRKFCRSVLNLPDDKKILLFISFYLNDSRKGFSELLNAVNSPDFSDVAICAVGEPDLSIETSCEIYYTGQIADKKFMPIVYSACDIYVMPSFQEAFAQTPVEAMACGLPVVAFPCSGMDELINEQNGIKTEDFTSGGLRKGIEKALNTRYDPELIRKDVSDRLSIKTITGKYISVYKDTLMAAIN